MNDQQNRSRVQNMQRNNSDYVEQLATKSREISQLQKQVNNFRREKKGGVSGSGSTGQNNSVL